jgi:hypothetical protein
MHFKEYLSQVGRKGGAVKSAKKAAACRENAKKPRPNARKDKRLAQG